MDYFEIVPNITDKIKKEPNEFSHYNALYNVCKNIEDLSEKMKATAALKECCTQGIVGLSPIAKKLADLIRETLLLEAKELRFDSYMQYIELYREPTKRFWLPRRSQLLPVVDAIQDLIDGKINILAVSLPPGTGKSTLEIFLHSMLIGAFPDNPSLASGHSGILTNSLFEGVLQIINDKEEYLWHDVYPNVRDIITNAKEQTIDINKKHRFSSLTCRAIGASLTGATRCEKLLSADDLVSGIEEAMSADRLEKLWTAYTNDLKSRKKLGCKELHLATRWSVHDVIGRLEVMYADDDRAKFIVIPALNDDGESNFNFKYNVGFDEQYFDDMRNNLDDASFRALFMNQPIEREGLLYHEDELRRYFDLPEREPDAILSICDTKDKGTDYAFLPVGYVFGDDYYIDDCVCDNGLPDVVDVRLSEILLRCKVKMCRFESNSAGGRVAEKIQKDIKEQHGITHITTKFTTSNKETKIIVNSAWVKEHCLFKDSTKYTNGSEYGKMMRFLCGYTMAGKNKHDDVPDGMAMFAEFAQSLRGNKVEVFKRTF